MKDPWQDSADFVTQYEGWRSKAYLNKGDVPTIGYGTTKKKWVSKGNITRDQGKQALMEDIYENEPLLRKNVKGYDDLPESAKIVLRDILYNVGQGNMFNKSPKFMKALNEGDWKTAAANMDWDNNKPGMGGAKKRNAARLVLFLSDLEKRVLPRVPQTVEMLENQESFLPVNLSPVATDYSLMSSQNARFVPSYLSAWNAEYSPSYGGILILMPDIKEYIENSIYNPYQEYKNGKSPIHIKPENRGKLTRLKKCTGKSEALLYNDGNPAHKKMVVFARNSRRWRH